MHQLERCTVGKLPPLVAPLHQGEKHGKEVKSLLRETVFVASASTNDFVSNEDLLIDKLVQTVRQDVASDPQIIQHLGESPATEEDLTNDEQCPPLADDLEGLCDGALHILEAD